MCLPVVVVIGRRGFQERQGSLPVEVVRAVPLPVELEQRRLHVQREEEGALGRGGGHHK